MIPKKLLALALGAFLLTFIGYQSGHYRMALECQQEAAKVAEMQSRNLAEANKAAQEELDNLTLEWRDQRERIEKDSADVVDRLTADNQRLRVKLKHVPSGATCPAPGPDPDGRAELHRDTAEALIGITKAADLHIKKLQEALRIMGGTSSGPES